MKITRFFLSFMILLSKNQIKSYLFSVIISIYNTGKYLEESIGSIINQTIGYKEIQIILVNDGSTDNSEEICLKYQKIYFNNIIYIKISHGGVSNARNIGLTLAKGEFINFLDSDDMWDNKAFENVLSFFQKHNDINFVSGRIKFFEAVNNYHFLDYKFYETRIVNVTKEYNCIQESSSTSFFKASYIYGKKFEKHIKSGEDIRFVNEILLLNPLMGLIRESIYLCRKRFEPTSRTQTQKKDPDFYFLSLKEVSIFLINKSIELHNIILPFIQYYIAYDILFRFEILSFKYLNSTDFMDYCKLLDSIIKKIDDIYFLEQKNFANIYKVLALSQKYKKDIKDYIYIDKGQLKYNDYTFINFKKNRNIIIWKRISIENNVLHLEGVDNLWITNEKYNYFCKIGNKTFYPIIKDYSANDFISMYGLFAKSKIIIFDIHLEELEEQIIYLFIKFNKDTYEIFTTQGYLTRLPKIKEGYFVTSNYIIKMIDKRLTLYKYNKMNLKYFEQQYRKQLNKLGKYNIIKLRKANVRYKKDFQNKKEIWLINDEKDKARDNGEYFFRYLRSKKIWGLDVYFVIQKNCTDFRRLKRLGHVLDLNSNEYLNKFLKSDKLITSVTNFWVENPFGEDRNLIVDLFNFKLIYIDNGIIKDDFSKILNHYEKNINLFITSTKNEYNSILSDKYGYNSNEVVLTGMPRFDNLEKYRKQKINQISNNRTILIAPTWRKFIKKSKDSPILSIIHSDNFKSTQFFQFYNSLINNKKLIQTMKINNYKGIFCLHHYFRAQWIDFTSNEVFEIKEFCDYQNLIMEASLLITDYSSVFFDFGYLEKPIIYTHFDYESYRLEEHPEGYFNYKKDGFGPIYDNVNSTVNSILKSIKKNNTIKNKYLKRINKFFSFHDENNCERVLKEILKRSNINDNNFLDYYAFSFYITVIFLIFVKLKKNNLKDIIFSDYSPLVSIATKFN